MPMTSSLLTKKGSADRREIGCFSFLAASMFANQCPLERKEELLTVRFGLLVQTSERNET